MSDGAVYAIVVVLLAAEFGLGFWRGKVHERNQYAPNQTFTLRAPVEWGTVNIQSSDVIVVDSTGRDVTELESLEGELTREGFRNVVVWIEGGMASFNAMSETTAEELLAAILDRELTE